MGIEYISNYYEYGIIVQRNVEMDNGIGGTIPNWSNYAIIWGRIRPLTGKELVMADKQTAISTHRLYCSLSVDINENDRIVYKNNKYEIVAPPANIMNFDNHFQIELKVIK